jgi:hypothetical protein
MMFSKACIALFALFLIACDEIVEPPTRLVRSRTDEATGPDFDTTRILVDASRDGNVWWWRGAPRPSNPNNEHQGAALARYLTESGYTVEELPRNTFVRHSQLKKNWLVIRPAFFPANPKDSAVYEWYWMESYSAMEIRAYQDYVAAGGNLLLLSGHGRYVMSDPLGLAFGIKFGGPTRGSPNLDTPLEHPVMQGVRDWYGSLMNGIIEWPSTAVIVARFPETSYTDLNRNEVADPDEPRGAVLMGVMPYGEGKILFCGCILTYEMVKQPLVQNTLAWFKGAFR